MLKHDCLSPVTIVLALCTCLCCAYVYVDTNLASIQSCVSLLSLYLSHNFGIGQPIPTDLSTGEVGQLITSIIPTGIQTVDMSYCNLTGVMGILYFNSRLHLQSLLLSNNRITEVGIDMYYVILWYNINRSIDQWMNAAHVRALT
jgi:phosphatidylserine synthase